MMRQAGATTAPASSNLGRSATLTPVIRLVARLVLVAVLLAPAPVHAAADGDALLSHALAMLGQLTDQFGNSYVTVIKANGVTFEIAPLPPDIYGRYARQPRRALLSTRRLDEDATVLASIIAHELRHARDGDLLAFGLIPDDCVEREAGAFEAQARVWRALWTGDLSTGTTIETGITRMTQRYEAEGLDGLRAMVRGMPLYQRECAPRDRG
jgi:hypothetical protein